MNIVIMAGGTGSIALQTGLYNILKDRSEVDVKVIVNAYDNGLSTGAVRKVMGGHILGPSDVRKNQTTRFFLENAAEIGSTASSKYQAMMKLLDHRFSVETSKARDYVFKMLDDSAISQEKKNILADGIETYFDQSLSSKIDYTDFSLANIIYAGLAAMKGYSLREAARIMADVLEIKDNVILNDDRSLFLGAVTKSGIQITDEGDIVSWNNYDDPIVDVFFTDTMGAPSLPVLSDEARLAIDEADVIILSSGTQWSSLIPTYASLGFKAKMDNFKGRVLMVMNRVPDKDAPDQSADDIIRTLVPKYFPEGQIDLIVDNTSIDQMSKVKADTIKTLLRSFNSFDLKLPISSSHDGKHHEGKLGRAVVKTIYRDYLDAACYMFDYDDTLVGRGNTFTQSSVANKQMLVSLHNTKPVAICTGNSIKAISIDGKYFHMMDYSELSPQPLLIYADGGINKYYYNTRARIEDEEVRPYTFIECIAPDAQFAESGAQSAPDLIKALRLAGIATNKIENRGNVMLSIKPIDPEYREIVRQLAVRVLNPINSQLKVKSAGRTTVEIATEHVTKAPAVLQMLEEHCQNADDTLVFVGDEFDYGNDREVALLAEQDPRIKCLKVKSPADTALFLLAVSMR